MLSWMSHQPSMYQVPSDDSSPLLDASMSVSLPESMGGMEPSLSLSTGSGSFGVTAEAFLT